VTGAGPFGTEREAAAAVQHITGSQAGTWRDGCLALLEDACRAAGVELGAYDHAILLWLAEREPSAVAVVAGLITRARQPQARAALLGEPGVAQPGGGWISGPSI
jgi:hypothetical protein